MKVTLFQASLLNTEPTMAAAMPPNKAAPLIGVMLNPEEGLQMFLSEVLVDSQAPAQLACHTSGRKASSPARINPNRATSLVVVKTFCIRLPPLIPRVLVYVSNPMMPMEASCAALMLK